MAPSSFLVIKRLGPWGDISCLLLTVRGGVTGAWAFLVLCGLLFLEKKQKVVEKKRIFWYSMVSYFWFVGTLVLLSGSEQVSGFTLQGCYATYSNDPNLPFGLSSDSLTVSQCSDYCSQRNSLRAILQLNNCACFSKTDFDLTFFPVNIVECTANCTDSLPCGERVFRRYSVYDLTPSSTAISATPFASPTLGSPSNSTNSSSVTASPTLGASTSPSVNPNVIH